MKDRVGPNHTRRNLLRGAAILATAIVSQSRKPHAQSYYYGSEGAPAWSYNDSAPSSQENRPCFLRGTPILTELGYLPIERLESGDRVVTLFAGVSEIAQVSSFTLSHAVLQRNWLEPSRPVRVKRGALSTDMGACCAFNGPMARKEGDGLSVALPATPPPPWAARGCPPEYGRALSLGCRIGDERRGGPDARVPPFSDRAAPSRCSGRRRWLLPTTEGTHASHRVRPSPVGTSR